MACGTARSSRSCRALRLRGHGTRPALASCWARRSRGATRLLRDHDVDTPVRTFGLPQEFLDHGERGKILDDQGLAPQHLARAITEAVARRTPELAHDQPA